ncbi:MAG: hypothetical protein HY756_08610 [Nitrospirae bacterium]|nr:hypothetical protein [Nitrospirota bacterium]
MTRWKAYISKLFLVYFLFYVVSPVCCAGSQLTEDFAITSETSRNVNNVHIVWELIFLKLTKDKDAKDPLNVHFLIKKKRAVLRTNNLLKIAQQELSVSTASADVVFLELTASLSNTIRPYHKDEPIILFSGLSPPVA